MSQWLTVVPIGAWRDQVKASQRRWVARLRTWRQPVWVCLLPTEGSACEATGMPAHDAALLQWRGWCAQHSGQYASLGLSARWLLSTVQPLSGMGASARRQAQAEAVARWMHLLGEDETSWHERWVTRAVVLSGEMLVSAVPRALVDDVLAVAAHHHVVLQWIGPWWAHGLQCRLAAERAAPSLALGGASTRALVMREPGWAVHAQVQRGVLSQLWAEPDRGEAPDGVSCVRLPVVADTTVRDGEDLWPTLAGHAAVWSVLP
jgi:hypothetical protein